MMRRPGAPAHPHRPRHPVPLSAAGKGGSRSSMGLPLRIQSEKLEPSPFRVRETRQRLSLDVLPAKNPLSPEGPVNRCREPPARTGEPNTAPLYLQDRGGVHVHQANL